MNNQKQKIKNKKRKTKKIRQLLRKRKQNQKQKKKVMNQTEGIRETTIEELEKLGIEKKNKRIRNRIRKDS